MRGPILYDMNHNFCHGWAESERATSTLSNALWMTPAAAIKAAIAVTDALKKTPERVPQVVQSRQHIKAADFVLRGCQHSAQRMRTYPANQEKTIKECYVNLTRLTRHYIFIQNQYIQYANWTTCQATPADGASGLQWRNWRTVRHDQGTISSPVVSKRTRLVARPEKPTACGASERCPITGIWQPWVHTEHSEQNGIHQYRRQTWLVVGQRFPDPQLAWMLDVPARCR